MRLFLRFSIPLILVLSLFAYSITPLFAKWTRAWFISDLILKGQMITTSIQDHLLQLVEKKSKKNIDQLFRTVTRDERILAIGYCDLISQEEYRSEFLPPHITCKSLQEGSKNPRDLQSTTLESQKGIFHLSLYPIQKEGTTQGFLILLYDLSYIQGLKDRALKYLFYSFLALSLIVSLITAIVAHFSWRGFTKNLTQGIKTILSGESLLLPLKKRKISAEVRPLVQDLKKIIRDLERSRKERDELQISWTSQSLKEILSKDLAEQEILVVSNREPYIHNRLSRLQSHIKSVHKKSGDDSTVNPLDSEIQVNFPASGLVTAIEPVMRACSGTWIAHGSGNADWEVVDKNHHISVPPKSPQYTLRRVPLSQEEEQGYYFGFSNEGLWPLCHVAHVRPQFRTEDWNMYQKVNARFAQAVVEEAQTENPVILVQDYHFALLPRLLRKQLPKATILTFWHIPWPNSESFGICPWKEEILDGLLGSSILGFHTQYHCNQFIESVDRFLESRIDRENSSITREGFLTAVSAYPISIEWPPQWLKQQVPIKQAQTIVRIEYNLGSVEKLGIGVDRLDYTKGILERFWAIEKLFQLYPEWIGKFTFLQIASPSREQIPAYHSLQEQVLQEAHRINQIYGREKYLPLCLIIENRKPEEVYQLYRAANLCFVSSLHDGMNLVAKEFVSSREDEEGVLILSCFTGAASELLEALIINPYDAVQGAEALNTALTMSRAEQKERMRIMRGLVQEFNVYRWAGRMLLDAARLRKRQKLDLFGRRNKR